MLYPLSYRGPWLVLYRRHAPSATMKPRSPMTRSKILWLILASYVAFVAYLNRTTLTSQFDTSYWKNKYDHSQWQLPLSVRTLGDDGLYLYEGYRLLTGGDPTRGNAEMPPLGKYAIGFSLALFHNGYVYGFIATSFALLVFFFLSRRLLGTTEWALATTLLFAADPLLTNQFPLTMLDSFQLLFFLLFALSLVRLTQAKKPSRTLTVTLISGFVLGCFASVKFPVFTPIVALGGLIVLWRKGRSMKLMAGLALAAIAGYLLPYVQYFRLGHSLIDWLKVQKWMFAFYRESALKPVWENAAATLLSGWQKNLFTHAWRPAEISSSAWPIITIVALFSFFHMSKTKKRHQNLLIWRIIIFWSCAFLIVFTVVPFWTRYLLLLLPLLYLATGSVLTTLRNRHVKFILFLSLITANLAGSLVILFPTPEKTVQQFLYDWRYGFFQDMYQHLTTDSAQSSDWTMFHRTGLTFFDDAQIEAVAIEPIDPSGPALPAGSLFVCAFLITRGIWGCFMKKLHFPLLKNADNGKSHGNGTFL